MLSQKVMTEQLEKETLIKIGGCNLDGIDPKDI